MTKLFLRKQCLLTLVFISLFYLCQGQDNESYTLGDPSSPVKAISWTGTITSQADAEPVISASIISDSGVRGITNIDGSFEITLQRQRYTFIISALGYSDKRIEIDAYSSGSTDIRLAIEDVLIDEVVIGGQSAQERITQITPGLQRMSAKQLDTQSKFFGEVDVLRSIQSMSGVHNTGEGASGFNVRGGNSDQNLILQDGHLIFNPSHALGFFSLFHPDLVEYVDLYKGGIPAKYGGRLSSVLSVETREGNKEKFKLKGGVGVISSRLTAEGPIIKDKVSFIVAGRYSYADWIFNLVDNPEIAESKALFNDVTVKLNGRLTPKTNVGVSFLRSQDDFQFGQEARFDYSTLSGEAYVKQLIGDRINLSFRFNRGQYNSSLFDLKGNDQSKFTNLIDYTRASADFLYAITDNLKINFGAEYNIYDVSPGDVEPLIPESIVRAKTLEREKANEVAGYGELQMSLNSSLDISAGLRITSFTNVGPNQVFTYPENEIRTVRNIVDSLSFGTGETIASYSGLEPRLSLRYSLDESASIKLGYARTYQFLAQISNTASATPIDIWQLSNQFIEPQFSDNFSIGFFKNFAESAYESSIEFFYRKANGIIDYIDFAELLLNDHIETELVTGIGRSYGAEFNLTKRLGTFRGDVSYTYSKSERQIEASAVQSGVNDGRWYPSNYDIPHVLNVNVTKTFSKSSLALNFTYRNGRPTTAPVSSYRNQNVLNIPIYSDRNKFRVPAFHRLDVAYTIGPFGKQESNWNQSVTLSIYNVYFRKNAYSVYFRQNPFESVQAIRVATLGTIFPSITYNFNLK